MNQTKTIIPSDIDLGIRVLQTNMGLKPTESLLVVTDPQMKDIEGKLWLEAGKKITTDTSMVVVENMTENAQEPPPEVAQIMLQADVVMLQTTYSLSHTKARKNACAKGARIASLPTVTMEMIRRTLSIDYNPIKMLTNKLTNGLSGKQVVVITNPLGTNLTLSITGRTPLPDTGFYLNPGDFGNLPAGEAFIAPVEGSSNGVFIVEGSFASIPTDQPVKVTVKSGKVTSIEGGKAAKEINDSINQVGEKARNIAELGIGTNPSTSSNGDVIEAEKTLGTVHIALGNNATFGGTVSVPFHSDGIILSPTLNVDDQVILKNGEFSFMNQPIQTLKGFRDFLPQEALKRQWLRQQLIKIFELWGYDPLETPTLEPYELICWSNWRR
jgi:leucyl aminopeptidase (aminopeptidase T)